MPEISKVTIDNTTYDLKVLADKIAPIKTKTYTDVIGTEDSWAGATFFFASIRPTTWNDLWEVRYRIRTYVPGVVGYDQFADVMITGYQDALKNYYSNNTVQSSVAYYHNLYRLKSAGYNNGYGHLLGVSLRSTNKPIDTNYKRTIEIEVYKLSGCEITFLDSCVKYADAPGTGSTNYNTYSEINYVTNGLQEQGDANDANYQNRIYYTSRKTYTKMPRYQISFTMKDASYVIPSNTIDNNLATLKTFTSEHFDPFGEIYFYNTTTNKNAGENLGNALLYRQVLADLRYSFNIVSAFGTGVTYAVGDYVNNGGALYKCTTAHPAAAWNASHFTVQAPKFSTSTAYAVNSYVMNNNILYKCTTAHAAGSWNDEHFTRVSKIEGHNIVLVARLPVYVVAVPQSDGTAVLHSDPITQDLPKTEDGLIYIFLGTAYEDTTPYSIELTIYHPVYEYKNGAVRLWTNSAINASTVNGHTVESDVPSNAVFTDTTYESKSAASGGTDVSLVTTGEKYTWNNKGTVSSVRVQATSPVQSSTSTAQTSTLNTTISLADAYGDTKNPYGSKTAKYVLAAPASAAGAPSFRALTNADVGLGNVENTKLSTWTGSSNLSTTSVGTLAAAATKSVDTSISSGSTSTNVPTSKAVADLVSSAIAASDAMIFKGTIGTGGDVTSLPTTYKTGWTYRVITAGTYAGNTCEIGDLIIALVDRSGSGNVNADWTVAQTNIDGAITAAGTGLSKSGSTLNHSNSVTAQTTQAVYPIKIDAQGHVSAYGSAQTILSLGTGSGNAFRGDYGNSAYAHAVTNKGSAFSSGLYKITTNSEGHVTAATAVAKSDITALGIPGDAGVTGVKGNAETNYRTGDVNITPNNIGAVAKNAELLTTNPFAPASLKGPYISKIDNSFYAANKRWTITSTKSSGSIPNLFDGSYETNLAITKGETAVITMDFSPESSGYFPGYPYGYILISFYYTGLPDSIAARVYCNYQSHGIGWHDITFSPISDNTSQNATYRGYQGFYNISQIEFTITAKSDINTLVSQIEMHLDRPDSRRNPFLSKYGAETLYYDLTAPNFNGKINNYTIAANVPSNAVFTDTKNTAGSTDSSSKLFLIGATSQAANPQTYSHDTAYVGTDGCLYSGGSKVLTAHQDISGKKNVQTAVSDPTASGTGLTFISTISQDTQGVITPTKKTVSTMGAASSTAAGTAGLVPAPGSGKQASFLRGDGTWVVPTNTWTALVGATSSANGSVGYINAAPPKDGYNTKYFRADGTWAVPPNTTYTANTTSIGSASAGTAISADDITGWTTNTPTAVTSKTVVTGGTTTDVPNISKKTVVTSATAATASYANGVLTITNGSVSTGDSVTVGTAIKAYTSLTTGDSVSVTPGTAATLNYTSRSIPNISVTATTVATGITAS